LFKSNGLEFHQIPNSLMSKPLLLLAFTKLKNQKEKSNDTFEFEKIASHCSEPKVWILTPEKYKDYDFCRIAIQNAHPSIESEVLLYLIEQNTRSTTNFQDTIQYIQRYLENRIPEEIKSHFYPDNSLIQFLESLNGLLNDAEQYQDFVKTLYNSDAFSPNELHIHH
jgi:hypothetical protein